jgi:hypothetical protein
VNHRTAVGFHTMYFFFPFVSRNSYSFVPSPKIAVALATRCPGTQLHRSRTLGPGVPVMFRPPPYNVSYILYTFLFAATCMPEFGLNVAPQKGSLYAFFYNVPYIPQFPTVLSFRNIGRIGHPISMVRR